MRKDFFFRPHTNLPVYNYTPLGGKVLCPPGTTQTHTLTILTHVYNECAAGVRLLQEFSFVIYPFNAKYLRARSDFAAYFLGSFEYLRFRICGGGGAARRMFLRAKEVYILRVWVNVRVSHVGCRVIHMGQHCFRSVCVRFKLSV